MMATPISGKCPTIKLRCTKWSSPWVDPFPPLCQRFRNPDRPCIWSSAAPPSPGESCQVPRQRSELHHADRFSSIAGRSNLNKSTEWCFRSWHRDVSLGRSAMSTTALVQSQNVPKWRQNKNDDIRRCCSHVSQWVPPQEHVIPQFFGGIISVGNDPRTGVPGLDRCSCQLWVGRPTYIASQVS